MRKSVSRTGGGGRVGPPPPPQQAASGSAAVRVPSHLPPHSPTHQAYCEVVTVCGRALVARGAGRGAPPSMGAQRGLPPGAARVRANSGEQNSGTGEVSGSEEGQPSRRAEEEERAAGHKQHEDELQRRGGAGHPACAAGAPPAPRRRRARRLPAAAEEAAGRLLPLGLLAGQRGDAVVLDAHVARHRLQAGGGAGGRAGENEPGSALQPGVCTQDS